MVTMVTNGNHADYEAVVKLSEDFNGADLRNVCTEAGMLVLLSSLPIPSLPPPPSPSFSLLLPSLLILSSSSTSLPYLTCLSPSGMFAIRAEREFVISEDFMKAVRKVSDNKKLETKMDYKTP